MSPAATTLAAFAAHLDALEALLDDPELELPVPVDLPAQLGPLAPGEEATATALLERAAHVETRLAGLRTRIGGELAALPRHRPTGRDRLPRHVDVQA